MKKHLEIIFPTMIAIAGLVLACSEAETFRQQIFLSPIGIVLLYIGGSWVKSILTKRDNS